MAEHLFASFILDRQQQLEIAIAAESVIEATPITGDIQPLPGSTLTTTTRQSRLPYRQESCSKVK